VSVRARSNCHPSERRAVAVGLRCRCGRRRGGVTARAGAASLVAASAAAAAAADNSMATAGNYLLGQAGRLAGCIPPAHVLLARCSAVFQAVAAASSPSRHSSVFRLKPVVSARSATRRQSAAVEGF